MSHEHVYSTPVVNQVTPALLDLLIMSVAIGSTSDSDLAAVLCRSPETIHTEWKRIRVAMGVRSRFEAVMVAISLGWVANPRSINYALNVNKSIQIN
jgi:hypothetical protein